MRERYRPAALARSASSLARPQCIFARSRPGLRAFVWHRTGGTPFANTSPMKNQVEALLAAHNRQEIVKTIENWFVGVMDDKGNAERVGPMAYEAAMSFREITLPLRSITDVQIWKDGNVVPEG